MPAVALFFGHDASGGVAVIIRGGGGEQMSLLLNGSKLGVALDGDHADQRISHALVGHLEGPFPLGAARIIAELNDVAGPFPVELDGEVKVTHPFTVVADIVLPGFEVFNPVIPGLR